MNKKKALEVFKLVSLKGVTQDILKKEFRKQAKIKHPDSQGGNKEDFVELKEAYELLLELIKYSDSDDIEGTSNSSNSPYHADSSPVSNIRDLKTLSKDEILDKYYQDTTNLKKSLALYQQSMDNQTIILGEIKSKVQSLVDEFESKKEELQKNMEKDMEKLEKSYRGGLLKKVMFFLPKMSENEFWDKYHKKVDTYSKKHSELDLKFFKEMLDLYGEGLNEIGKNIDKG
jgi:curved DNA-binding protein CbpA